MEWYQHTAIWAITEDRRKRMNFIDQRKQLDEIHGDLEDKKAEAPDVDPVVWNWQEKAKKILAGEKWKSLKVVKSIIKPLIPSGIYAVSNRVGDSLKTETQMSWFADRLKERSTWQGIVAVLSAVGVAFSPDQKEAIITAGVALIGVIAAFTKDNND